jgi:hypothetical protein
MSSEPNETAGFRNAIAPEILAAIEKQFHQVINGRAGELLKEQPDIMLPKLDETTPASEENAAWFAVPGMYGGFKYWLDFTEEQPILITESWCRVEGGSGQRHEISTKKSRLVAEGFV